MLTVLITLIATTPPMASIEDKTPNAQPKSKPKSKPKPKTKRKVVRDSSDLPTYQQLLTRETKKLGDNVAVKNPEVWTGALELLDKVAAEGRQADNELASQEAEIAAKRLGYAVVFFAGQGSVHGVVQTDQDPNHRANPCPLNDEYLVRLVKAFATGGVVGDRRTPIRVCAPPEGLPPDLVKEMAAVNIMDPKSPIPRLRLICEHARREEQLERDIFALSDGKRLLSDNKLAERQIELRSLRQSRNLATLLNGNHRINAMLATCQPIADAVLNIAMAERNGDENFDAETEWKLITKMLKSATYVVEVYAYDTPPHILTLLAEYERARPQYAPLAGESMWWLVENQETVAAYMVEQGKAANCEDAVSQINALRERRGTSGEVSESQAVLLERLAKLPMNRRGTLLGDKECLALMAYPTTMEMACDTRMALCIYNTRLNNTQAKAMGQDRGASFVAHAWLGMRTLLVLANTALGDGLTDAENFVASIDIAGIDCKGLEEACTHFSNLTSKPQDVPPFLSLWEPDGHALFEGCLTTHVYRAGMAVCNADYFNSAFATALPRVYFDFGKRMSEGRGDDERARRFGTAAALYGLLPLWGIGVSSDKPFFYPTAVLPSKSVFTAYAESIRLPGESLGGWVLELLLNRYQLIWTAGSGSVGTSRQTAGWWERVDGRHQILLRCFRNSRLGSVNARLSTAIHLLEDPRLHDAIYKIDNLLGGEDPKNQKLVALDTAPDLRSSCQAMKSAPKSGGLAYPILSKFLPRVGNSYGNLVSAQKQLNNARKAVKAFIFNQRGTIDSMYADHPILNVIPKVYFTNGDVRLWALGWQDDKAKMMGTIHALIGWFLVSKELRLATLPRIFSVI